MDGRSNPTNEVQRMEHSIMGPRGKPKQTDEWVGPSRGQVRGAQTRTFVLCSTISKAVSTRKGRRKRCVKLCDRGENKQHNSEEEVQTTSAPTQDTGKRNALDEKTPRCVRDLKKKACKRDADVEYMNKKKEERRKKEEKENGRHSRHVSTYSLERYAV